MIETQANFLSLLKAQMSESYYDGFVKGCNTAPWYYSNGLVIESWFSKALMPGLVFSFILYGLKTFFLY